GASVDATSAAPLVFFTGFTFHVGVRNADVTHLRVIERLAPNDRLNVRFGAARRAGGHALLATLAARRSRCVEEGLVCSARPRSRWKRVFERETADFAATCAHCITVCVISRECIRRVAYRAPALHCAPTRPLSAFGAQAHRCRCFTCVCLERG